MFEEVFPVLVRSVWGEGKPNRQRKCSWPLGRGEKMTCLPLRGKQFLTVSLHPGVQPQEGAWTRVKYASCLAGFSALQEKHHSHPRFAVRKELYCPFDEQLNGILVAMDILFPMKAKNCLEEF